MKASRFFRSLSFAAFFLLLTAPFAAAAEHKTWEEKTLWDMLVLGGVVMIPLAGFSIAMVWLIIDGAQRSSLKRMMPESEVEKQRNFFRAGDYVGAYQACVDNPGASTTSSAPASSMSVTARTPPKTEFSPKLAVSNPGRAPVSPISR